MGTCAEDTGSSQVRIAKNLGVTMLRPWLSQRSGRLDVSCEFGMLSGCLRRANIAASSMRMRSAVFMTCR